MKTQAIYSPMGQSYFFNNFGSSSGRSRQFDRNKIQSKTKPSLRLVKNSSIKEPSFEDLLRRELLAHTVSKTELKKSSIQSLHEYWA